MYGSPVAMASSKVNGKLGIIYETENNLEKATRRCSIEEEKCQASS